MKYRPAATFGIWVGDDNGATFKFLRWLLEDEAAPELSLPAAAQVFLNNGSARGAELPAGRYMIQTLTRGRSGPSVQCLVFDAVAVPRPLRVSIPKN